MTGNKPNGLVLRGPKTRKVTGDLTVDGWIEIADGGVLECTGEVRAHGVIIESNGTLRCTSLTTNVLHADALTGATLEATSVATRVLDTVQRALVKLIESGALTFEFHSHSGGDLNPSWDRSIGTNPLRDDLWAEGPDRIEIDLFALREAMIRGENVFTDDKSLV